MSEKKMPKIRFPEFTGDWEQRKLGDVVSLFGGNAFSSSDSVQYGARWLKIANVGRGQIKWDEESYLPISFLEEYSSYCLKKGDFVMALTRPILDRDLKIAEITEDNILLNQRVAKLIFNCDKKFGYQLFRKSSTVDMIANELAGTDPPNLSVNTLTNIFVMLPCISEQKKISEFLNNLDNLITLHKRKCNKIKEYKKGCLQKMFPKDGANVPEVRFPDFTDAWEQRKVSEIADRYDNLRVPVAANLRVKGTTPYYGANGIQDYVDGYTHDGEFILVAEDGANDLKNYPVNYVNGRVWVNNHAHVLQTKKNLADNRFLGYAISRADIESVLVGGGRAKLNADVLMNISLLVPRKNEQIRISSFVSSLDNLITLHQRECDKYKELKKGLLQQMFV